MTFKTRSGTQFHDCTFDQRSAETNLTIICPSLKTFVCNLSDSGRHVNVDTRHVDTDPTRVSRRVGERTWERGCPSLLIVPPNPTMSFWSQTTSVRRKTQLEYASLLRGYLFIRRLHTYNRACMGQERLSSLALMHVHYQAKIVLDEAW